MPKVNGRFEINHKKVSKISFLSGTISVCLLRILAIMLLNYITYICALFKQQNLTLHKLTESKHQNDKHPPATDGLALDLLKK